MRKLKLQMHVSIDGFVATSNDDGSGIFNWDDEVRKFSIANTRNVDCIILGRKVAKSFIPHWASVAARPDDADYAIARIITKTPKIVFSKTLSKSPWDNTQLAGGNLVVEINRLKRQKGKDMLVYGGAGFVSSLIQHGLIDEYYLLINPVAVGRGLPIFKGLKKSLKLKLVKCKPFRCGSIMAQYQPK